jgi:DNA invertase Pin-like site-specific DNA recombinase
MSTEERKCEARTTSGSQCRRLGTIYRKHEDGQEYLVCKSHGKEESLKPFLAKGPKRLTRVVGYLRVSTEGQETEKNKADVLHFANERNLSPVEWVEEKVSGTQDWRKRKLGEVLETLREGDVIITPELSRLGRNTLQVLEVIKAAKEKDISVHAIKGGWSLNGSIESKVLLNVFAMVAEIERDLISARTKEGMKAKKAAGVKMGRPKGPGKSKLDKYRPEIEALLANGSPKKFIAKRYGCTEATLYNWMDKNKISVEAKP